MSAVVHGLAPGLGAQAFRAGLVASGLAPVVAARLAGLDLSGPAVSRDRPGRGIGRS